MLAALLVGWALGIVFLALGLPAASPLAVSAALVLLVLMASRGKLLASWQRAAAMAILLVPLSAWWTAVRAPRAGPHDPSRLLVRGPLRYVRISGEVASDPQPVQNGSTFDLAARALLVPDRVPLSGRVRVRLDGCEPVRYGETVLLTGNLHLPPHPTNPGENDYALYLARRGIFSSCSADGVRVVQAAGPSFPAWAIATKDACSALLSRGMSKREGALMGSLVFGGSAVPVSEGERQAFTEIGLAQVLAASGLQVSLLLHALLFVLDRLPFGRRASSGLAAALLTVYAAMCGMPASIVRATFMGYCLLCARSAHRRLAPSAPLLVSALAMLVLRPAWLWDVGFELSFLATFGLFHTLPLLEASFPTPWRWLTRGLWSTASCLLWVLPIQILLFNQLSAWAVISNLWALVFVDALTIAGFAVVAMGSLLPGILPWLNAPLGALLWLFSWGVERIHTLPGAVCSVATPPMLAVLGCYLALLAVHRPPWLRHHGLALAGVGLFAGLLGWGQIFPRPPVFALWMLDVGQGDGIVLRTPHGRWMVVDAGPAWAGGDAGAATIVPFLRREGCQRLSLVALTHPHDDHLGGMGSVLSAFPVDRFLDSGQHFPSPHYQALLAQLLAERVPVQVLERGDHLALDGVAIQVLGPPPRLFVGTRSDPNNNSLIMRLSYGKVRILLAGDAEFAAEGALVQHCAADLACDVLKVGHHGSRYGSGSAFLALAHPRYCLVSDGRDNRYHQPDPGTLRRLERYGPVFRTDTRGCIEVTTDGRRVQVTCPASEG